MSTFEPDLESRQQAWERLDEYLTRNEVLPEQLERMADVEVGQTPSEVVYEENKLRLLHYESRTDEQHPVPVLVVYALINRPYILDLQPDRSVVRSLLDAGLDVYMIDWGEPSSLDAHLTLSDYVDRYIDNCVDVVRECSGEAAINVLGYCMGGTMSVMHAALYPEKVRALGLLATGSCFDDTGGVLELWGDEEYYTPETVTETFGNVPAEFLDAGFALMDPVTNYVTKYVQLYEDIDDDDFVENFARMERWLSDGVDVPGEAYREFLERIYQDNALVEGDLRLDGRRVDPANVTAPVLQIVGEYDHLVPPSASTPLNDRVGTDDATTMEFPSGHVGLAVSSRSHADLWPEVADWYVSRSGGGSVEDVDGIGPNYARRLRGAGVSTLADLAAADPEELAEDVDVSAERVRGWIDQAEELLSD